MQVACWPPSYSDAAEREQRAYVEAQRSLREADDREQRLLCIVTRLICT